MAPPFQLSREGIAEIDGSRVSPDRDEIDEIAEIAEIDRIQSVSGLDRDEG